MPFLLAAAVLVTSSPSPPSSPGLRRLFSQDIQKFFRSVRAPHDETQASGVIHSWHQMHPKTPSVKGVDPDTPSDSEIPSLTQPVAQPVAQSVQKPKKKRQSKVFKAAVAAAVVSVGNRGVGNLRLIGLVGLGPASRGFTCSLLDRLLSSFNLPTKCPI
jgi:hypothetical protein